MTLNTIGYEGANPHDFVATLQAAKVNIVVDIRDRAQSRRKGFSKTALENHLKEAGIGYIHFRSLGDPKEGREAARSGQWDKFQQIFSNVLETNEACAALDAIEELAQIKSICLLCYERDHKTCHRKIVSNILQKRLGTKARHLGVKKFEQSYQP